MDTLAARQALDARPVLRQVWRWYWALLIANAFDLLFTYVAAERGVPEANRFVQPILLTPWLFVVKFVALGALALGLIRLTFVPWGDRPLRILRMIRIAALIYLILMAFHLLGLWLTG